MSLISRKRRPAASKKARRLDGIEPLEARIAPSVAVSFTGGTLTVTLGSSSDTASISATDANGDNLAVAGTGFGGNTFSNVTAVILNFEASTQTATATDSHGVFNLSKGFSITSVAGNNGDAFSDTTGGNAFDFSNWFGTGSMTNTGGSPDVVSAVKSGNFTLSNTNLSNSDGMSLGLSNITTANLTDTGGGHNFTVSGWNFGGSLIDTGATGDTVIAVKSGGFTLSNSNLSSSDFMNLGLTKITSAQLTDTAGGNTFTLSGWTGGGSLTSSGAAPDTVTASEFGNYTLSNTNLSSSGGLNISLSNIKTANLTETAGGNSFNVSNWSNGGSLIDSGTNLDTVIASKNASFTLSNSNLSSSDGLNLSLTKIGTANLTDTGGGHSFTVSGWTHGGSLADSAGAGDTVIASKIGNFTLSISALVTTDGMNLGLSNITSANLTDGGGGNTFTVSGWSHGGSLANSGATADTVIAVKNGGYALSNTELSSSDGMDVSLSNIGIANLTDTGGVGNTFTVNGWTGGGALVDSNNSGMPDVVTASEAGGFTLTNTGVSSSVGLSLTLTNFGTANLTDTLGGNTFTVSGWTHGGSLTDSSTTPDTIIASKNGSFNLGNFSLSNTDGTSLNLSGITTATLTDTGGGHTFTLSSWTGQGSLTDAGATADTVAASEGGSYTLTNGNLSNSNGLSMSLSNIGAANLTDSGGGNTFTVSGWTHGGSLIDTNSSADTVIASKDASFSLSNSALFSDDGMSLNLTNITTATLTDTDGGNSFTILSWTGSGSLIDAGATADTLIASKASGFTLTNTHLSSPDGMNLLLTNITIANLTDTAGGNTFNVSGWTGGGSLTNSGIGVDTVAVTAAGDYTLSNGNLANTDGLNLSLSNIATANLTETAGGHSFTVSGWSNGGSLIDSSGTADSVTASKSGGFALSNSNLSSTDGMSLGLTNITSATLTDTEGGNSFTVSGWTHSGSLSDSGSTADTVVASKSGGFSLSNTGLSSTDGMSLTLANIAIAALTDTGAGHTFTLNGWTGGGSLTDSGGTTDTVAASEAGNYTLTNTNLSNSDGLNMSLAGIHTANLTETAGGHSFDVSGWSHGGSLVDSGSAGDSIIAAKASGFTLSNASLASPDGLSVALTKIGSAALTDTAGGNTFALNGWTGGGSLTDTGATADTVAASEAGSYTLTNTNLSNSNGLNVSLSNVATANLTETGGNASFDVSGWTHNGTLTDSGNSADTVVASKNANFTLTNGKVSASDGLSLNLTNVTAADLTDTGGGHTFTVSGWTKDGSLTDSGPTGDVVISSKNAGYSLSDSALSSSDGMDLDLSNITTANLTDTGGGNSFDITGWSGSATLASTGASDTLVDQEDANFTLTNSSLLRTFQSGPVPAISISNIGTADLAGGPSGDSFDLSKWTGVATITGGSGDDTLIVNYGPGGNNGDPAASVGLITFHGNGGSGDQIVFTGTGGENIVWTPSDSDSNAGTVTANYASHSTVINYDGVTGSVDVSTAASLTLNTTQAENFTLDSVSGKASLATSAGNGVTHAMQFTAVPTLAINLGTGEGSSDSSSLTINSLSGDSALKTLTVTTGAGADTLAVDTGSLNLPVPGGSFTWIAGDGFDTISASADVSMTLTPGALTLAGGGSISFPNLDVENANLTGGNSGNEFDLATWGGSATVTGGTGNDTLFIDYAHNGDPSADTGLVTFHGNGGTGDRIVFIGNGSENLVWNPSDTTSNAGALTIGYGAHSSTVAYDGLTLGFNISSAASLTLSTAKAENYTLNGTGGGDAILSTTPGNAVSQFMLFTSVPTLHINLGTSESATDSSNLTIDSLLGESALKTLAITTGAGADTLSLVSAVTSLDLPASGGTFSWVGGGGHDTLNAMAGVSMALSNTGLAYSGDAAGLVFSNSDIVTAHLVDTTGGHTFTTTGWTGSGSLASFGASDTVTYQDTITNTDLPITVNQTVKHGKVTQTINVTYSIGTVLTNSALYSTNGMNLSLSNIGSANLTAGSGNSETIDASQYTGTLALYGSSGATGHNNDVLIAGLGRNSLYGGLQSDRFVLSGLSISDSLTPSIDAAGGVSGQSDLIDYSGAKDGVTVNLGKTGTAQAVNKKAAWKSEGLLTLNGLFDNLLGSKYADKLTGDLLSNMICGGGGADTIAGGGVPLAAAGQPKNHDYLYGNASTVFVHPAKALQEIDTTSRNNVSPFPTIFPIVIPDFIFAVIASGASADPYIISEASV